MTNKHHTEMLLNDWRNNNHNSGKMEIVEGIKGRIHKKKLGLKCLVSMTELATGDKKCMFQMLLPPQPNFHVKVIAPLKEMQHI